MSSSPPAKRQRQDVEIVRSEIWHPDGSVVLQAGNTQFRVHWSFLSRHSSFFRDMQGLPQPPDQPSLSLEGCPVIELSDRVEDVENVLETLYNPLFFAQQALPLPVIASHIRLGRKYDFTDILQSVVERLIHENPMSLEEYDALITPATGVYTPTRIAFFRSFRFDLVILARENNLFSVLPCAYYRTLCLPQTGIFDGIARRDGTIATLSPIDQRLLSLGRAAILRAQWDVGYTFGWVQDAEEKDCTTVSACRRKKSSFFRRQVVNGNVIALHPVSNINFLNLCSDGMESARTKMAAGRRKMWESLPTFFELPAWDELKNEL
ncbi:hypothetical protein FB451DRAFT_1297355 [Mycena latifolia]|nr:hypothetical protein FB451DRAFT_1297355 [Mycena latifolia]